MQLSLHAGTASFLKLEFPVPKDGSPTTLKISIEHFTTWAYFKSKDIADLFCVQRNLIYILDNAGTLLISSQECCIESNALQDL